MIQGVCFQALDQAEDHVKTAEGIRRKQKKAEDKKPPIECRRLLIDQLQAKNSMDLDPEVE